VLSPRPHAISSHRRAAPLPPPPVKSIPRSRSPPANHSTSFPRPQCTSRGHVLPSKTSPLPSPQAAVATAAGHRRSPTPAAPPSQLRPPVATRWAPSRAPPLARPGARSARRNLVGAAASHGQGAQLLSPDSLQGSRCKIPSFIVFDLCRNL
jgi:hypothetical protein